MKNINKSPNLSKENLSIIELFSGIGAQKRGIDLTNLFNCKVIATSDVDKDAVLAYAAVHHELDEKTINKYNDYPSEDVMRQELINKNIGYDFKKKSNPIQRLKGDNLKKYWLAQKLANNLGDISRINKLPKADMWTYSFPCTDISVSGKQDGLKSTCQDCRKEFNPIELELDKGGKCPYCGSTNLDSTRSGLLKEVERLLINAKNENNLPKYLLLENVKNLVGKKFIDSFNAWISKLDTLGYNTYWKVVNAKDCGIPQNRERIFAISIRKDVDNQQFQFMSEFDNGLRLKDFLEDNVDEKYYLSDEIQNRLQITDETFTKNVIGTTKPEFRTIGKRDLIYNSEGIMGCLISSDYKQILESNRLILSTILTGGKWGKIHESCRRVYSTNGIAPTISTCAGGNTEPKIVCEQRKDEGLRFYKGDYIGTLRTIDSCGDKRVIELKEENFRVRKLTPKECWRLMGFHDEDFEKAQNLGISDSTGYKLAGNSIVTNCIKGIMEHLYKAQCNPNYLCSDEITLS